MGNLRESAETAIRQCMDVASDESCLIVTDNERKPIGDALYLVAEEITDNAVILQYPPGEQHGNEPPAPVAAAMKNADEVLAPTTKSVSHTRARSEATEAGVRVATMPGITEEVFKKGLQADYEQILQHCNSLYKQVIGASQIRVTSPSGTDITIEVDERDWHKDTGNVTDPGDFSNLPAGEVYISPTNGNGKFVVDGTMAGQGLLDEDQTIVFEVKNGLISSIGDDAVRETLESAAESVGDAAYNLAEFGIGANNGVNDLIGSVLLDEKAMGTVHFAIGDDAGFGGETDAPIHLDGIIRNPTVYADGGEIHLPTRD